MDNVLLHIGDELIVKTSAKITGLVNITAFQETITGETVTRTLDRKFKISSDNIFWSDWAELTVENLSAVTYLCEHELNFEIKYARTGTDDSGEIVFSNITFSGSRTAVPFVAPTLLSSIFANYVGTDELSHIETNIFKKLYFRGIVPEYIERAKNNSYEEDEDYINLFFSVARFFSLFITFFKRWENFRNDFDLLREQVRGYGIYFDESSITLEELQYLAQNLLAQARQRGTKLIFSRKGDELPSGTAPIDGEFIRLTRNRSCDELLYESIPLWKSGWCMGQSSPLYKGTAQAINLNKTKENTKDFQSLSNFVITKDSTYTGGSYALANVDGKRVLRITFTGTRGQVGLGRQSLSTPVGDNVYAVDSAMDYEITFAFRVTSTTNMTALALHFGIEGFDINKEYLNDAFVKPNGDVITGTFVDEPMDLWKSGVWYFVRGIIHAYSSENVPSEGLNLVGNDIGTNLYYNNSFVKYILPQIQIRNMNSTSTIDIWDYKIRPLIRGKNITRLKDGSLDNRSLGFIQASKIFYTYFRNNNNSQSQQEITDIIEKYLYPMNTIDMFTIMNNY